MASQKNKIPVFLLGQIDGPPPEFVTKSFAAMLVTDCYASYVNPAQHKVGIQMRTKIALPALKAEYRRMTSRAIPVILPPREPEPLVLSYPRLGQESDARERQAQLWMKATRF